jgi:hypothetical protein
MQLRDEKMHLNKPRFELRSTTALRESDSCRLEPSQGGHLHFEHLTRLLGLLQRSPVAIGASAHSEMRRAQTDAQQVRENTLARIQLARQLPR